METIFKIFILYVFVIDIIIGFYIVNLLYYYFSFYFTIYYIFKELLIIFPILLFYNILAYKLKGALKWILNTYYRFVIGSPKKNS
jgi:hypothetical protein